MNCPIAEVHEVAICFHDPVINQVFAELLEARGVSAKVVENLKEIGEKERIITEPRYLEQLNKRFLANCLVVGYRRPSTEEPFRSLSQPLTEQKIEQALAELLS